MNRVDVRRFEFDFDTTWAGFFTDSKLRIYSRYGGRDEHDPESRLSKPSLLQTMNEVLIAHRSVELSAKQDKPVSPRDWKIVWHPEPATSATPMDLPLLRKNHNGCVHCHQIREYSLLQAFHDGQFERDLLFPFPLPETLGLEFDRKHGHRIASIREDSVAMKSGLRIGDVIAQCNDVPVRSEQDFRWALHRLPGASKSLTLKIGRVSQDATTNALAVHSIEVLLPENWRQSELQWRKSTRSIPVDWGFRAAAMSKNERREANLSEDGMAILVLSVKPQGLSASIGLQKGDIITAADGDSRHRTLDQLRSDLLRQYQPENTVTFTVRRAGATTQLSGPFPHWKTTETSVP